MSTYPGEKTDRIAQFLRRYQIKQMTMGGFNLVLHDVLGVQASNRAFWYMTQLQKHGIISIEGHMLTVLPS